MNIARQQQGFTILEVLVAFVLASLLLGVILSGFSTGLGSVVRADNQSRAALVAQSRLAELSVLKTLEETELEGVAEGTDSAFRWKIRVAPLQWELAGALAEKNHVLWRIDIEVLWDSGLREHSYGLTTLRMQKEGG
ncbi:MAG: type II secretion system protein [Thiopseudomonas sp.]